MGQPEQFLMLHDLGEDAERPALDEMTDAELLEVHFALNQAKVVRPGKWLGRVEAEMVSRGMISIQ